MFMQGCPQCLSKEFLFANVKKHWQEIWGVLVSVAADVLCVKLLDL